MDIPDTPQALLEAGSDAALTALHPSFTNLVPRDQRLVRLVQAELLRGELTDVAFASMVRTVLTVWHTLGTRALTSTWCELHASSEIDTDWVEAIAHLSRMDQFHETLRTALDLNPGEPYPGSEEPLGCYRLRGPGDNAQ